MIAVGAIPRRDAPRHLVGERFTAAGIRIVSVSPGSVDTEMLVGSGFDPQMSADDVAAMIVHAALDAPAALKADAYIRKEWLEV